MKKIIYLFYAIGLLMAVSSCKKTGDKANVFSNVSNFKQGSFLLLDSTLNKNLDFSNLAVSKVGITVTQAPTGEAIKSIVLFASKTPAYDTTQWARIKTVAYTGPKTVLSISGAELASALKVGLETLAPGSNYTFFTRVITASGAQYDASNTGNDSGQGLVTGAYYFSAFSFTAYIVCPFVGPVKGSYTVIRDDWADWSPGATVQVLDGPKANEIDLSMVYPNPAFGDLVNHLVVDIDPATGTATVKKVNFGNYGGGYNMTAEGTGANDVAGYVFSCTGFITLQMEFIANGPGGNGYDNGPTTLTLQKAVPK